ncbi:MAG: hypothetical protein WD773_10800 [Gemmatimonadales bacterium]
MGVVRRSAERLDWRYLERWAAEFVGIAGRENMPHLLTELRREAEG